MEVSEVKRLKEMEAENRKLKQLIGDKELDIIALKAALSKSTNAFTEAQSCEGNDRQRSKCTPFV